MPDGPQRQPEQLKMFMTADEIIGTTTPGDFPDAPDPEHQWGLKEQGARTRGAKPLRRHETVGEGDSLRASIEAEGVHEPVWIGHRASQPKPILVNGHHRVATERSLSRQRYIPVEHTEIKERAPHSMPDAPPSDDKPRKFVM